MDDPSAADRQLARSWSPPRWLRGLHLVAAECPTPSPVSPEDRLRLVFELMSFAVARLREQAERRGCTPDELLRIYDRAVDRLRARA
jgi:hypothetical protein